VGGAHVFSIARLPSELCRRPIVQTAVRPLFVVVVAPEGDLPPGVEQILKPAHPQTLFAQPSVKAFDMGVLCWLGGLDMHQLDLLFNTLGKEMPARQFGAVVAAN